MKRNIIRIDESKCTGCGLCVPNCAEGSLEIRNGKAVLVRDALCDGLGACLGHCPEGALVIEEREAEEFDEQLVEERLSGIGREPTVSHSPAPAHGGCPSAQIRTVATAGGCPSSRAVDLGNRPATPSQTEAEERPSELRHWPVQLGLLPPTAPFFRGADLVLTADCVPFAYANFHPRFLRDHAVAVACPKLDNAGAHFQKLIQLFSQGGLRSIKVLRMEVPCCGGLSAMASQALKESGAEIPMTEIIIGRDGSVVEERPLAHAVNA